MFNELTVPYFEVSIKDIRQKLEGVKLEVSKSSALSIEESSTAASSSVDKQAYFSHDAYPAIFDVDTMKAFADFGYNKVPFLFKSEKAGRKLFLNCSSQIPFNTIVSEAINEFFAKRSCSADAEFIVFDSIVEETRGLYAEILGLSPTLDSEKICFTRDSCESLHLIQESFVFEKGDTVVILDNEFQHNGFSWLGFVCKHPELELNLKVIDTKCDKNFVLNAETLAPYVSGDDSVKVVSLSCTMYQSGLKNDIKSITSKYNSHGIHTIVDLTQDCGFQTVDVLDMGCSAAFFSTFKGLFIPQGLGILYMSDRLLEEIHHIPPFVNIKGLSNFNPDDLKVDCNFPLEASLHQKSALKFEHCNKPNLQIYASYHMLQFLLHKLKVANIEAYLSYLRQRLESILRSFNIEIFTGECPSSSNQQADAKSPNIVVVNINNPQWMKFLRENDCFVSQFRGIIRFSIGIYNTVEDLEALECLLHKGIGQGIPFKV